MVPEFSIVRGNPLVLAPLKLPVAPPATMIRPPLHRLPADQLNVPVIVTSAFPASVPEENVRTGRLCAALKFTVAPLSVTAPVVKIGPRRLCVPPGKPMLPAPVMLPPARLLKLPDRFSAVPARRSISPLLLPLEARFKVPAVTLTVPELLKVTAVKSVVVPAPLLLKVPLLLNAWAAAEL